MNMIDAEFFMKVVELMSFSRAAEALFVTQQAVSQHVRRLEETYQVQLFERRPSLRLTAAGERMVEAVREITEREQRLISELSSSKEQFSGEIAIGLPPNRSTAFVSEFYPEFYKAYPRMSLRLDERTSANLSTAIRRNEIDLALPLQSDFSIGYDPEIFEVIPLETESLYVVISDEMLRQTFPGRYPGCKAEFVNGVSLFDFSKLPMFLHPSTSHLHETIVGKLVRNGTPPNIRIRTSLTSSLVPLCADGYGIFFSQPMPLEHLFRTNRQCFDTLNLFPVKEFHDNRRTLLIYHKQKYLNEPLRDSIEIICRLYERHASFIEDFNRYKRESMKLS